MYVPITQVWWDSQRTCRLLIDSGRYQPARRLMTPYLTPFISGTAGAVADLVSSAALIAERNEDYKTSSFYTHRQTPFMDVC